jgi:hypothetical protein
MLNANHEYKVSKEVAVYYFKALSTNLLKKVMKITKTLHRIDDSQTEIRTGTFQMKVQCATASLACWIAGIRLAGNGPLAAHGVVTFPTVLGNKLASCVCLSVLRSLIQLQTPISQTLINVPYDNLYEHHAVGDPHILVCSNFMPSELPTSWSCKPVRRGTKV